MGDDGMIPMKVVPASGVWYSLNGHYGHIPMDQAQEQCTLVTSGRITFKAEEKGKAAGHFNNGDFEGDAWTCVARHPWGTSPGFWSPSHPDSCWYEYWSGLQHSEDFWFVIL